MVKIGLFCEGISESKILTHIIEKYLGSDNVVVNPLQPKQDDGKQQGFGGWHEVLLRCNDDDVNDVFATNDFLVIQIDSDMSHPDGYKAITDEEKIQGIDDEIHYAKIVNRLESNLSLEVVEKYRGKIIFAICFNETECWLIPLYYENDPKKCCSTTNCIYILNQGLPDKIGYIPDKDKNSPAAIATYRAILKNLKAKNIPVVAQYNYGFQRFIEQLDVIKASLPNQQG